MVAILPPTLGQLGHYGKKLALSWQYLPTYLNIPSFASQYWRKFGTLGIDEVLVVFFAVPIFGLNERRSLV